MDEVRYMIPLWNQDPPEGMIDFLHDNPLPWDGDDGGIILYDADGNEIATGFPGDWVVRGEDGVYKIEKGSSECSST